MKDIRKNRTSALVEFSFPLRHDVICHLKLPTDLYVNEIKRLASFLDSLSVDGNCSEIPNS